MLAEHSVHLGADAHPRGVPPPSRTPQSVFPLMAPAAADFSAYEGFATVRGPPGEPPRQLPLRVENLPPRLLRRPGAAAAAAAAAAGARAPLRGARLRLGAELKALLGPYEAVLQARLEGAPDLAAFFEELRDAVSRALTAAPPPRPARAAESYLRALDHLSALPEGTVASVGADAATVDLVVRDRAGRAHALAVALPADYPLSPPAVSADFPLPLDLKAWDPSASSMRDVVSAALSASDSFSWIWDQLEELDRNAYVIEPAEKPPPRAAASRTVALGGHVTLLVALDPKAGPAQPPRVQILGAEAAVAPKRAALSAALQGWTAASRLLETLERALGKLPSPAGAAAGGGAGGAAEEPPSAECVICYSYRYPGEARTLARGAAAVRGGGKRAPRACFAWCESLAILSRIIVSSSESTSSSPFRWSFFRCAGPGRWLPAAGSLREPEVRATLPPDVPGACVGEEPPDALLARVSSARFPPLHSRRLRLPRAATPGGVAPRIGDRDQSVQHAFRHVRLLRGAPVVRRSQESRRRSLRWSVCLWMFLVRMRSSDSGAVAACVALVLSTRPQSSISVVVPT